MKGEKIIYDKNKEIIFSKDKTEIFFSDLYVLKGENIYFDRNLLSISSKKKAILKDNYSNILNLEGFEYSIENKHIRSKRLIFLDSKKNKFITKNSMIDLNEQKIASKDVQLYFNENGQLGKNARIKGSSLIKDNDTTVISNGILTTC